MTIPHADAALQTPGPLPSLAYGSADLNGWFTVCHAALRSVDVKVARVEAKPKPDTHFTVTAETRDPTPISP